MDSQKIVFFYYENFSPKMGHDPTTLELRVSCATDWASRAVLENIEELESFFFHLRSSSASNGIAKDCVLNIIKSFRPTWSSNPRPWDEESHALPTELAGLYYVN